MRMLPWMGVMVGSAWYFRALWAQRASETLVVQAPSATRLRLLVSDDAPARELGVWGHVPHNEEAG